MGPFQPVRIDKRLNSTLYFKMHWFSRIFKLSRLSSASAAGSIGPKSLRRVRTKAAQFFNQSQSSGGFSTEGSKNSRAVPRRIRGQCLEEFEGSASKIRQGKSDFCSVIIKGRRVRAEM